MSNKFADLGFEPVETVDSFDTALQRTLSFEGGNTVDHAGATNLGVTQDTYNNWRKRQGLPTKSVRDIDREEAKQLYKQEYFEKPGFSKLPANVAGVLFDFGVNAGTPRASMALQKAVGASPDGVIGPKTLKAVDGFVNRKGEQPLLQSIIDQRSKHVDSLIKKNPAKYKKYENGWKNRINAIKAEFNLSALNPFAVSEASASEIPQNDFVDLGFEEAAPSAVQPVESFDDLGFEPEQPKPFSGSDKYREFAKPRLEAQNESFLKGLVGIERKDDSLLKEHPLESVIGEGFGQLLGLVAVGGALGGVGKAVIQEGIKKYGIKNLPKILTAARVAQSGTTFGAKGIIDTAGKAASGGEVGIEDLEKIGEDVAFGGALGAVGSIAKPLMRIPAEMLFGFSTAKIQGADNINAAVNGAVFGLFGALNRTDLNIQARKIAVSEIEKNLSAKLTELNPGLKTEKAKAQAQEFIYGSATKITGEKSPDKALEKVLLGKENNLKYLDELNTRVKNFTPTKITEGPKGITSTVPPKPETALNSPETSPFVPKQPATPIERASKHGEVVGIDAKSGLPVIDTSVKPSDPELPIISYDSNFTKEQMVNQAKEINQNAMLSKDAQSIIEQAGGKFKKVFTDDGETLVYYDTPSGSTQTIRPELLSVENVKAKIDKFESAKNIPAEVRTPTPTKGIVPIQDVSAPAGENVIKGGELLESKSQEASQKGNEERLLTPSDVSTPSAGPDTAIAGKATATPLHAEALKYKTAEEFVGEQTFYRGEGSGTGGNYFTRNQEFANEFAGIKPLTETTIPESSIYRPKVLPEAVKEQQVTNAISEAKKAGAKAVYVSEGSPFGEPVESVFVFDKSALKTKSQLTAIYNEAHGQKVGKGTEEPVNREALAKEYADSLEQPLSDFHKRFINQVLDKDTSNLLKVLAQGAGRNIKSKKMFSKITGIKLPTTVGGIKETIYKYTGAEEPKPKESPAKPVKLSKEEQLLRMKNARAEKTLQGKVRFDGKVVTKKQMIDELMSKASTPTVRVTDDENALRRLLDERRDLGRNGMQNINAKKIAEINQKIDAGVKKTEYFIKTPGGSYYVVNKTEYDYAKGIEKKPKGDPASVKPPTISQVQAAASPQALEQRIEQLNKFGQANAILRRTATLRQAAGRYSPKENTVKIDEETILSNSSYMSVLGHELGHAIEKNVTGKIQQITSGKEGFELFGEKVDQAKIRAELEAVTEDLVGKARMDDKPEYFYQSTELIARFFEKRIFSPGNLADLAPTAVNAIELQSIKHPIIQEFLMAATGTIDKGTPKFALLRDMRETYQKHLGKFVGNRAYDQEMVYRAMKERGKIVLEKFINDKMKMVKDSPESLFRSAESIKISRGGKPEFGTKDYAIAKTPEEEQSLILAGYEKTPMPVVEDGVAYPQYARQRYTPEEGKQIFDSLSDNGKKLILDFTAERKDAKDFFNREVIKETYGIKSQLEGWVHHYFDDRPGSTVMGGQKFKQRVAGTRKHRTGTEGYVEDFKKAMTKALVDLEGEKVFNEFIPKMLAMVTKPLGKGQTPDPGWIEVVGNLKSGVGLPIEKRATIIDSVTGERVPMKQSRYQMPKEIYERYKLWRGLIDEASTAVRVVNDLNRYWRINILTHPGTSTTNFISGGIQFSSKILTDFYREVLTGKLSMPDTQANISAMVKVLMPKGWMDAPDWVYGSDLSNFYGEFMKKNSPISTSIDTYGNKALYMFGVVERYWKKVIMTADGVADLKSLNEMTPEGLRIPTKEEAEMIAAINESVDLYGYDYDNVPQWLEQHQKSVVGQAIKPFAKYPYKYAKQILNMVGEAFDQSKPWQDRVAKVLALATIVSAYAMFSYDRKKKQKTPVADKSLDIPPRLSTRGRVFITTDDKGREIFTRVAKYPFLNLTEAGMQFVDGNWSTGVDVLSDMLGSIGPAAAVGLMAFNYRSKYNQYEKPEVILGDNLATFLPGYRILNDVSRALDPFQRKQETFGQTFTQIIPTTDQALQEKLHGKIRTERVPIEGDVGLEPVGSRTTVDVNLENVKEDILLSLFTGVYRTRLDPKVVEAYIIRKQKNLDKKNAKQ